MATTPFSYLLLQKKALSKNFVSYNNDLLLLIILQVVCAQLSDSAPCCVSEDYLSRYIQLGLEHPKGHSHFSDV